MTSTRNRIPDNISAGLEDIMSVMHDTWPPVEKACDRARDQRDVVALVNLNQVVTNLAKIERYARAARRGEYAGERISDRIRPPAGQAG